MRGWIIFFLIMMVFFSWSCEDPNTLSVSKTFSGNDLQTIFSDTFSVVTSTVQLDTVLTSGTQTVLLGRYNDHDLGWVSASSYFQIGYSGGLLPDISSVFDSAVLTLPYNHTFSGDTTQDVKINVYQLTEPMVPRTLPNTYDLRLSVYNSSVGFYNSSKIAHAADPIVSATVRFIPHHDSVYLRLPDAFGANWFRLAKGMAQPDSQGDSSRFFSDVSKFITYYFYGLHLDVDPATNACVVGFKAQGLKIRLYYRRYVGDVLRPTHFDFPVQYYPNQSALYQFNNIQYDRTGTGLSSIQLNDPLSSVSTGNVSYVQSGTGLVTRLDFPSLKNFFSVNSGIVLNAAYLEVYPLQGSYPKNLLPPSLLQLYSTDASNLPLSYLSGGAASIQYDFEYGINTMYRYQLFPYIFGQIRSTSTNVAPLILGPASGQGSSVQRVYIGDRFHPINKLNQTVTRIKLKIYYTYVPN